MLQPITRACATHFWARLIVLAALVLCSQGNASAEVVSIAPGVTLERVLPKTNPDEVLSLLVSVRSGDLTRTERMRVSAQLSDGTTLSKSLHGGDPDLWLPIRATPGGTVRLSIQSSGSTRPHPVLIEATPIPVAASERHAIEAEPNNDWQHANPLLLGRDVYGSADDVDYLHNTNEGEEGLDWYRVELTEPGDSLVFFHLDLVDRDVSADLRLFTLNDHGDVEPFDTGKDPMETIHDRERVRYSTHLSRVLSRGTYYLRVNANHPCYVLRTRRLAVPPYRDPRLAVDVGLHYLQNAGDAWFSQIPREGNRTVRSVSLHETATRCTACHAAAFPLDATLWAHRKGYPIRNRPGVQYLEDRLRASITPLPGFDDLGWQRFIATPLEAQGLQGGLVADFDRQIGGRPDPMFDRFVPFLRAAWSARTALPEDERNGVIPLDSKFELAWRDWQVLTEAARRQGDRESFEAARTIERLVADPASDLRIETLQDRLHRLLCWWMFDMEANSGRIFDESESILRLQNDDGGWHELDSRSGPSAVYTTGQVVWTLLQVGASRDDPRVAKALNYLLAAQQSFGGWFQAETHENFRTPMRETRFAVMALASAYPRGEPQPGWGGSGSLTQSNSIVEVLDDLEGLWDRPDSDPGSLEKAVSGLLNHPVPLVRAHAASCLGRIGSESAISPLVGSLDDPSKIVVRASAESLRRLGRSGMAGNLLVEALASRDPLTRRGAARVFEHPFPGLDNRLDLATRLLLLSDDPDLWTRLSVIRALRQWFYRSSDPALKRRIVYAFLSRMARETDPVVSRNLSQNLYIILDENLGGGVSLQKNLMALPDPLRERALTARENTEQQVLLGPILSALGSAEDRQRAAILASFDGSFFEGRTYARQPTNQIDVGNDREFGFLSEPPQRLLEDTFSSVFQRETRPIPLTQALTLAEFFRVPGRTSRREISTALIVALSSPEESVSRTAAEIVASSLSLHDLSEDPETLALLLKALDGPVPVRRALANALVRSPETLNQPEIRAKLERGLHRQELLLSLAPVLADPSFSSQEVQNCLRRGLPRLRSETDLNAFLDLLGRRLDVLNSPKLPDPVRLLLLRALASPSASPRRHALRLLETRSSRDLAIPPSLMLGALSLHDQEELLSALALLPSEADLCQRSDVQEHLLRLLIDPTAPIRKKTLELVASLHLLQSSPPSLARRVRSLARDPSLGVRAVQVLREAGLDPDRITPDVVPGKRQPPDYSVFRDRINPLFYQPGPDGISCVDCHVNHAVLRLSEAASPQDLSDVQIRLNYNSVLKVINEGDPSSSLLLRKPISPPGQGDPDPESPTGLTHVGGPRWSSFDHPAYQEILLWLRETADD